MLQGIETIFLVALAILKVARKDLLQQDFEGLMKYFRVNIPKTYRSEENAKHLMTVACAVKLKKLNKVRRAHPCRKSLKFVPYLTLLGPFINDVIQLGGGGWYVLL